MKTFYSKKSTKAGWGMWLYIVGLSVIGALLYHWYTLHYNYFAKLGIPGLKPKFPIGNTLGNFNKKRNFTYDLDDIYQ